MTHYAFSTNLGVKPLGRGQVASAVIQRENALFREYQGDLSKARVADPLEKAKALRNAYVNEAVRSGDLNAADRFRALFASLKLPL